MRAFHPTTLVCREVVELITELLGDTLEPERRARIEQHLLVCPPCTIHVGQVRATIALSGELREQAPDVQEMSSELRDAFRKTTGGGGGS